MRIRKPFAAAFVALSLGASYLGFAPIAIPWSEYHSDKALHFVTFFIVTTVFYWIIDTNRRRVIHITLVVCTVFLGIGSEIFQFSLRNGRNFDPYDIAANIVGSLAGAGICTWYHRRMIERKRVAKGYRSVSDGDAELGEGNDIELGQGTGPQETGVTETNLTLELDNWDEHAEDDWDDEEAPPPAPAAAVDGAKKRDD